MSEATSSVGPGTVLADRYELTEEIGRGGFGMVYRARQMNMDRDVAVKILPPQFLSVHDVVERFKREAKLASRLRHPNTITLHDYGKHQNLLFIVMELLTGEDLADLLRREGRLKPERVVQIARQVLKSLAEAHDQGIVHRDLKPENIFLSIMGDDHDVVKVLDFGIAKLALPESMHDENHRALTISGSTVGTPTYMSPEQAAGENVDGQTDLYALGVIMYEMLNGRPPFHHRDPVRVMRAHLFEPVPEFRNTALRGGLLDRVVRKALEKERENRFNSANEFLLALAGEPVARPVVAGVDIASLDEPSTQEFDPGDGFPEKKNTEDIPASADNAFTQTLQFANAVSKTKPEDDVIPFGIVDEPAPRAKAAVRSSMSEQSGLTNDAPPPGFSMPDASTSGSSILTVISAPDESEEDEVILLTSKKVDPTRASASGAANAGSKSAPAPTPAADHVDSGHHLPVARDTKDMPAETAEDGENDAEAWEWGASIDTAGHGAVSRGAGGGFLIVVLVLLLLLGAGAAAYFGGYLDAYIR